MTALNANGIVEHQVTRLRTETSQNLDAENLGWRTRVPPDQWVASIE
jgi:hypothetical protein